MNKKFKDYLESKGFKVEKNLGIGKIDDFEVRAVYNAFSNVAPIEFTFVCYSEDSKKIELVNRLIDKKIKYLTCDYNAYGITIGTNGFTASKCIEKLDDLLNMVVENLKELEFKGSAYCPYCGLEMTDDSVTLSRNQLFVKIHNGCKEAINREIKEENEDFDKQPNNYLKGFAGAFLGGFAGALVMIVFYMFNFVTAVSSLVAFTLGTFLYKKLGGKPNKMMVLIVSLTSVVMILLGFVGIYLYASNKICTNNDIQLSGIQAFKFCFNNVEEFSKAFEYDLALQILFIICGMGYNVYLVNKQVKRVKNI